MRCNWRRWLWGLIPLIGVGLLAAHLERGPIEQDLAQRAKQALSDTGAPWADVSFNGRDANLEGRAIHDSQPVEAEMALRRVWGVRNVDNNASLPPLVEPYLWSARRRGKSVRLHGYVPNRATRQIIVGMAKAALPGFEVVDRMHLARGVPPADTWHAGLSFALKQLASLKRGEVRLEGLAMSISGEAEDAAAYRAVNADLKRGLPKGITLGSAQIAAPVVSPYTWSAQFAGSQLVLSGYVAGEGARAELAAAAATAPPGTNIVDRMELADGAPPGWAAVAAALVRELVRLQSGTAEMKDAALTVGGIAVDETRAQGVRAGLRAALPSGYKLTDQIRVREPPKAEPKPSAEPAPPAPAEAKEASPPAASEPKVAAPSPPAEPSPAQAMPAPQAAAPKTAAAPPGPKNLTAPCQDNLSRIASVGPIVFESDSARLEAGSLETLDRLATAAKACPGVRIGIEGHADIEGSAEYNQRLSLRRAQAVAAHLVGAGVKQVEATGFGSSRPVAPNDTPVNRAKNRRTEIVVRQP